MIIKNIKLFFKENLTLAILFVLSQIIAVIMIMFCYGVFMNVGYKMNDIANREKAYSFRFKSYAGKSKVLAKDVKEVFPEILDNYEEDIYSTIVSGNAFTEKGRRKIRCDFKLKKENNKLLYDVGSYDIKTLSYFINESWFTADDYNNAVGQVIIPYSLREISENKQIIADEEFDVKGYEVDKPDDGESGLSETVSMPLESMPDNAWIDWIYVVFNRPISISEYQDLCDRFNSSFNDNVEVPDYNRVDIKDTDALISMRYATVGIGVIAALTVCLVFRYVLMKRFYMTAIYRICGVSSVRVFLMYFAEILIYLLTNLGLGMMIFFFVIKKNLLVKYEWFNVIFSDLGFLKYIVSYLIIVSIMSLGIIIYELRITPYKSLRYIAD